MTARKRPYGLFEVVGLELEYPVVDGELRPRPLVEEALRLIHGRRTSETELRHTGFSNELAAHVFEIKTLHPQRSLATAERRLGDGLAMFAGLLEREFGARLLPTGMHPFMRPEDTGLWRRAGQRIYRAYDRIFDTSGHGWLNVQAAHVNLPFGSERETMWLHNAIACLLPYLPAIAASSPIYEGRIGPHLDNRLAFYRDNQRRLPLVTGRVIPEFAHSFAEYRRVVLHPIYRALDRIPGGDVLRHEWVNSRGAIVRFMRRAIEIRVLDVQECVKADVAIAVFVRGALRWIVGQLRDGRLTLPDHAALVNDFELVIERGRHADVAAPHFSGRRGGQTVPARRILESLNEHARDHVTLDERAYLAIIDARLTKGNLAERIVRAVRRSAPHPGRKQTAAIRAIYEELAQCLRHNDIWPR